jgi:hypothetical protein
VLSGLDPEKFPERLRALRAIEVLEHAATPETRQVLTGLAKGAAELRLTRDAKAALDRLTQSPKR